MNKINMFCLPFAGGSVYSYRDYSRYISPFIHIHPLELPGRGKRIKEPFITDMQTAVDDLFLQIKDQLHVPYFIYGHSMGALMGFLLAKKLVRSGLPAPLHLFLTGCTGPSTRTEELRRYLLPKEDFIAELTLLGGLPDEILNNKELIDFFEPILRADFKTIDRYVYAADHDPLDIPFTIMTGSEENMDDREIYAWQKESVREISHYQFNGKHFFIFDHAKEIMQKIAEELKPAYSQKI